MDTNELDAYLALYAQEQLIGEQIAGIARAIRKQSRKATELREQLSVYFGLLTQTQQHRILLEQSLELS